MWSNGGLPSRPTMTGVRPLRDGLMNCALPDGSPKQHSLSIGGTRPRMLPRAGIGGPDKRAPRAAFDLNNWSTVR